MDRSGKITTHTHMQQRIDTAGNWTADNPVLYNGEIGYEEQLGTGGKLLPPKVKIGDGVTHWNDLPYQTGDDGNGFITYITPTETINAGEEHEFEYPISERILTQTYEVSDGGTFDNNNIAFDNEEKYLQQNSNCTAIANGKAQLKGSSDGNAVQFDGNSAYGEVPYNAIYAPKSAITVEAMAFMADWGSSSRTEALVSKTQNSGYEIKMNGSTVGSGNVGFIIYIKGSYYGAVAQLSTLSSGWHRFTGNFDGRYIKFFIDGKLTESHDMGTTYSIDYTVNNSLIFGAEASPDKGPESTQPSYFSGKLADVRIWNVALTDQAVASQAFSELTGSESGLVGYWKMNEGSGNILNDSSPNKNNATLYKAYLWTSDESFFSNKYSANAPYYIATTDASNYLLSKVVSINSVTIPVTTPTNTS